MCRKKNQLNVPRETEYIKATMSGFFKWVSNDSDGTRFCLHNVKNDNSHENSSVCQNVQRL